MNQILRTEKVCKSFITDNEVNNVIKNLDIQIMEGDFTVIMGSSGSGKSTLMYLLSGMDKVTAGDVYLGEEKITNLNESEMARLRRNKIGFVFQGMNLISDLTVRENITCPAFKTGKKRSEIETRADKLLEEMGMSEHQNKYPNQLSGGQKQRTAICRALMNEPEIIFADEPTGALNSQAGESVLDAFMTLHMRGQSIVMVTHDLKSAAYGNRIIYLKDGRIDGELNIGEYRKEDAKEREQTIYQFLKEKNW